MYVKPTGKSNRQIIVNAITHCCLSGAVNKEAKEKSLLVSPLTLASSTVPSSLLFLAVANFREVKSTQPYVPWPQKIFSRKISKAMF